MGADGLGNLCLPSCAGDSACSIPPQTIAPECLEVIRDWTPKLARALKVVGLINIQYAIQDNQARY
jgi:carbamoyl-phosphate synthase large subunit